MRMEKLAKYEAILAGDLNKIRENLTLNYDGFIYSAIKRILWH